MSRKQIPPEALVQLRSRLELFPERSRERRALIEEASASYGVSVDTLYRCLRKQRRPQAISAFRQGNATEAGPFRDGALLRGDCSDENPH